MAAKAAARKRYQALHAAGKTDEARSGRLGFWGNKVLMPRAVTIMS